MGRKCLFPNCQSGSRSERKCQKENNLQNKTFFSFPKDLNLRAKWEQAIGCKARPYSVVCELHFSPGDIKKYDEVKIHNKVVLLERKIPQLNPEAIPVPSTQNESIHNGALKESLNAENINLMETEEHYVELEKLDEVPVTHEVQETIKTISHESHETTIEQRCDDENSNFINFVFTNLSDWYYSVISGIKLPINWGAMLYHDKVVISMWKFNSPLPEKQMFVFKDFSIKIYFDKNEIHQPPGIQISMNNIQDVINNINILDGLIPCDGPGDNQIKDNRCVGYVSCKKKYLRFGHYRCDNCHKRRTINKLLEKKKQRLYLQQKAKLQRNRTKLRLTNAKLERAKKKVRNIKQEMKNLKKKSASQNSEVVEQEILKLPESQQENVRACFNAAKKTSHGNRFTQQWIYECILMRIKNRKLYEHLRNHQILVLPHNDTLRKYIKRMGSAYGFNESLFKVLSEKSKLMDDSECRGTLLVDEIQLSKSVKLNRTRCQFDGFINLGTYTPVDSKEDLGDHACVLMYQPFRGSWVQTIACFLSKSCVKSDQLQPIILEAILLLERSGFYVDVVTTDGASWNRTMWTKFGVDKENISCKHPCDSERKLWFCSDFPHLIKTFRNKLVSAEETTTPDGIVKLSHWRAIIEIESDKKFVYEMKIAHKLTPDHLNPKYFQKMNVPMAFQLFNDRVTAAMNLYKDYHKNLHDVEPTIKLIKRVDALINAMMSRTPTNALRPDSQEQQAITDFLQFLKDWKALSETNGTNFLTNQTYIGFEVTLKATLEILEFLTKEYNYKYIMTSRLNQDALERFFSLVRGACGSNDHPDSILFGQMFLLLSTYSLIKPVKGSNVSGGELLTTLLQATELCYENPEKEEWLLVIDSLFNEKNDSSNHELVEQSSDCSGLYNIPDFTTIYMSGYIAFKASRWTKCKECISSLKTENLQVQLEQKMITVLSKGYLTHPSESLERLITILETTILKTFKVSNLNADTLFEISYALQDYTLPLVGCVNHAESLSKTIVCFYLMMRAEFIAKNFNKNKLYDLKQKTRKARKDSKLSN